MKYIFFGTPRIAMLVLEGLLDRGFLPQAVVANPDRPTGRKHLVTSPLVKQLLQERDPAGAIKIFQPEKVSEIKEDLRALAPDLFIVAAYTQILPKEILAIPRFGAIGVHPSLLPKYRGPSPLSSAILAGEAVTGVTLYLMDKKMDNGPTLAASQFRIEGRDHLELEAALAALGAEMLVKMVPEFLSGGLGPKVQDHALASFTKKFATDDGFVLWEDLVRATEGQKDIAQAIWQKIRAFNPEPGAWTLKGDRRIKLLAADLQGGKLVLRQIQRAGKNPEAAKEPLP